MISPPFVSFIEAVPAVIVISILISSSTIFAQSPPEVFNQAEELDLSGPRVGLTFLSSTEKLEEALNIEDADPILTLFGWHWEYTTKPEGADVTLLVESVALVAGLDKGYFLPTYTAIIGMRTQGGFEFGIGPNLSLGGPGLAFAMGQNYNYGGIHIPVQVAYVSGKSGGRLTLITGFTLRAYKNK